MGSSDDGIQQASHVVVSGTYSSNPTIPVQQSDPLVPAKNEEEEEEREEVGVRKEKEKDFVRPWAVADFPKD